MILKGSDRLNMVVKLRMQYYREKFQDIFDTNEMFLRCTRALSRLLYFTAVVSVSRQLFNNTDEKCNKTAKINFYHRK